MRIAQFLEAKPSRTGKTIQIIDTSRRNEYVVASIPRDIGDLLLQDDTLENLKKAFEHYRDILPSSETRRNDYIAAKTEAELYRETPYAPTAPIAPKSAPVDNDFFEMCF